MSDDISLLSAIEGLTQITEDNLQELFTTTPFHGIHDGSRLIGLRSGVHRCFVGDYVWNLGYATLLITKDDLKSTIQKFLVPETVVDYTQLSMLGEVPNPWKASTYLNGV